MERPFIERIWEQSIEQDSWTPETGRFDEGPHCIILRNAWIIPKVRV
jgi:hypothetical protein